ncbi:TetR/AcrR family transcriptional regulator [Bradyrhizobium jicamae]|uniref:TetR/AcrR family transcriptional regulator n=1 Tax=Bradyrhizobium jicamae TaxID=280332 RepID=UPI001BA9F68E|nr:TetR/AcrR family transcriptional regulator [Bradyrhizobium jicamae]MBR0754336.1 TetR/AcrR family transcriptional regulator [Bradyrhizobium jicamae]
MVKHDRHLESGAVGHKPEERRDDVKLRRRGNRPMRADARRNVARLLQTAAAVFLAEGLDVPLQRIAETAGIGIGTVYRHFPHRSALIEAVFGPEVDACADAASVLTAKHEPSEALALWVERYVDFLTSKRGLATVLRSKEAAFATMPADFGKRLRPALQTLLEGAIAAGDVCPGIEPNDLLRAITLLCTPARDDPSYARRMTALLLDGLQLRAGSRKGKRNCDGD